MVTRIMKLRIKLNFRGFIEFMRKNHNYGGEMETIYMSQNTNDRYKPYTWVGGGGFYIQEGKVCRGHGRYKAFIRTQRIINN